MPFRDLIGHRRVVALLARSIAQQSLPPSLVFAGPDTARTRAAAVAVAQALNCLHPVHSADTLAGAAGIAGAASEPLEPFQIDACGVCASCTRIARGVHPDAIVVEPGDNGSIRIEQVRDVIDRAAYRPFEGRRRVVVVDQADALVAAAQNALLKTLEEPPPCSVFILVTARPDVLLATVRSRCIRLWFAEGGTREVDVDAREAAVRVLGHAAATPDARRRLEGAKDLLAGTGSGGATDRAQLAAHLQAMASVLRDVQVLGTRADAGHLDNADLRPALDRLTPVFRGERGMRAFAAVDQALAAVDRNAGVKIVADWVVLAL